MTCTDGNLGRRSVALGIVPHDAQLPAAPWHGFWLFDDRLVQVETISAELSVSEPEEIKMYATTFKAFADVAVFGEKARAREIEVQAGLRD